MIFLKNGELGEIYFFMGFVELMEGLQLLNMKLITTSKVGIRLEVQISNGARRNRLDIDRLLIFATCSFVYHG